MIRVQILNLEYPVNLAVDVVYLLCVAGLEKLSYREIEVLARHDLPSDCDCRLGCTNPAPFLRFMFVCDEAKDCALARTVLSHERELRAPTHDKISSIEYGSAVAI